MVKIILCPCFLSIWRQQWLCLGYFCMNKFVFISLRPYCICLALHIVFLSVTVLYLFDIEHCISLCHCVVWHWTFRAFPFQFVGGFLFPLSSFVCPSRPAGEVANMPSSLKSLFTFPLISFLLLLILFQYFLLILLILSFNTLFAQAGRLEN